MTRISHVRFLSIFALAASLGAPSVAAAGPHGGGHHGGGGHGGAGTFHGGTASWHVSRPTIRDHRAAGPAAGHLPYPQHLPGYGAYGHYDGHWPYGYAVYPGPYGADYQTYPYGPPGTTDAVAPPPPSARSRFAVAGHVGQLQREGGVAASLAGLSLRWRGRTFEGELELGRRVYVDDDRTERTLAGTVYANLGDVDLLHPYLLAGAGLIDRDRRFGALGAGLALPLAARLTLTGDLRAAWIGAHDHHSDMAAPDVQARSVEGRLGLVLDL